MNENLEVKPGAGEAGPEAEPQAGEYGLHIRLNRAMQPKLDSAVELAYEMGDIQKPTLGHLMNLYINWGLMIQYKKWAARYYR